MAPKEFGRKRRFRSIAGLSSFDQEVFHLLYESGVGQETAHQMLTSTFHSVTRSSIAESTERIEQVLTTNDRLRLARRPLKTNDNEIEGEQGHELHDDKPNPEVKAALNEHKERLRRALGSLSPQDRLLVRLRFEEDVTLGQVAKLMGLGNAQRADRHLREILSRLRKLIE